MGNSKRTGIAAVQSYRRRGAKKKLAEDYISAFKISNDPIDLNEAIQSYRKRGAEKKSAEDYISAFKISNDPMDLNEAHKYAESESDKREITRLNKELDRALFEQAKKSGEFDNFIKQYPNSNHIKQAKYLYHVAKDCNGSVIPLQYLNVYADVGKCVEIQATKLQTISRNSGLFESFIRMAGEEHDLFYIEFPSEIRGSFVNALAKLKGVFRYSTKIGTKNEVPHLYFISEGK